MKVVAYVRVSTDLQQEKGTDKTQIRDIKNFCKSNDYELVKTYQDCISGAAEVQPEYLDAINHLEKDEIYGLVVWDQSRLTRSPITFYQLIAAIEDTEKKILGVKEEIDLDPNRGGLLAEVRAVFNRHERLRIKRRQKAGIERYMDEHNGEWGRKKKKINKKRFLELFETLEGDFSATARILRVSRSTLYKWIKDEKLNLEELREKINLGRKQ